MIDRTVTLGFDGGHPCLAVGERWYRVVELLPGPGVEHRFLLSLLGSGRSLLVTLERHGWRCPCREKKLLSGCRHVQTIRTFLEFRDTLKPSEERTDAVSVHREADHAVLGLSGEDDGDNGLDSA